MWESIQWAVVWGWYWKVCIVVSVFLMFVTYCGNGKPDFWQSNRNRSLSVREFFLMIFFAFFPVLNVCLILHAIRLPDGLWYRFWNFKLFEEKK